MKKSTSITLFLILLLLMALRLDAQVTITQWTFEGNTITPSTGTGTAAVIGGVTSAYSTSGVGGTIGWQTTNYPAQGTGSGIGGTQFDVSTAGFQNIILTWDQRHSNSAANRIRLKYSLDGTTWVDFQATSANATNAKSAIDVGFDNGRYLADAGDTWYVRSANFSSITGANNNSKFAVRIVSEFADGASYLASTSTSAYASTGTLRFDNVTFSGTAIANTPPQITNVVHTPTTNINSSTMVFVSADITDVDGTVVEAKIKVGTSPGTYNSFTFNLMNLTGNKWETTTPIPPMFTSGTTVYYVIWAKDNNNGERTSAERSYIVIDLATEPTNHATNFTAVATSSGSVQVSFTEPSGVAGYLVKGSSVSYSAIAAPTDAAAETDGGLIKNLATGTPTHTFSGLNPSTTYYFKVFPYNGSGNTLNYKTDGTVPQAEATTPAATVTPTLTDVIVPQYIQGINGTNSHRIPFAFRVTFNNLTPNATYRFINQIVAAADASTVNGSGNPIYVGADGTFRQTTSPGMTTAGQYGEFTTDASGSYTGWFMSEPTGNDRFTPGNEVFLRIRINDGNNGTTAVNYFTTASSVKVINFGTDNSNANQGTAVRGVTDAGSKNFVFLYDNPEGTGRPIAGTSIESTGINWVALTSYAAFYRNDVAGVNGSWGTIIPNVSPNGVKCIAELSLTSGNLVNSVSSSDGQWGATNTVNPTGGTTNVLVINLKAKPAIKASPTTLSPFSYVVNQGPSATQVIVVSGSDLTTNIMVTAPSEYEVSLTQDGTYGASVSLSPTAGTVTNTTVFLRLKAGLAVGEYNNKQLTLASTGATNIILTCNGSVVSAQPANHVTLFTITATTLSSVTLGWSDAMPAVAGYLIKGSTSSFADIQNPVDGVLETNGLLVKNVNAGIQTAQFTSLEADKSYYFKIFPFNGTGAGIDYKTDGTVPQVMAKIPVPPQITEVLMPQYIQGMSGTNNNRVPFAFRATISNLNPSTTYRFINQATDATDTAPTASGSGNPIYAKTSGVFVRSSSPSLSTANNYGEFTTDVNGSYTGWFILETTGNARFAAGNQIYMKIRLNDGNNGTTAVTYLTAPGAVKVIDFGTEASANQGTAIRGVLTSQARNFVFLFDETTTPSRPLFGTTIEQVGITFATNTSYAAFYRTEVAGKDDNWGGIVPNINSKGVRRLGIYDLTNGSLISDYDAPAGKWGTVNTVNPAGGMTNVIVIDPLAKQPGDANGDGIINVLDIIAMVNYIMGQNPAQFEAAAADLNGDGKIDVLDIIATVNKIMAGKK